MPESLAQVKQISFLTPEEQLTLNQSLGHEYLAMFGLVEEFILPYVVDHARPQLSGDDYRMRALLQFAGEESKHIRLFRRFRQEFENGFGSKCDFIGPAEDVRRFVLSHSPLGVGIAILHIEWLTSSVQELAHAPLAGRVAAYQARYFDCRVDREGCYPQRDRSGLCRLRRNRNVY